MIHIDLRAWISDLSLWLDTAKQLIILRSESINPLAGVVIKLECIAICQSSGFRNAHSTAAFSALSIPILNRHYFVGEIALIHVKIQTVHGNQLDESDVICLSFLINDVVAKHETAFLTCMCMEVNENLKALVLLCLLNHGLATGPDSWLISLRWIKIESMGR